MPKNLRMSLSFYKYGPKVGEVLSLLFCVMPREDSLECVQQTCQTRQIIGRLRELVKKPEAASRT